MNTPTIREQLQISLETSEGDVLRALEHIARQFEEIYTTMSFEGIEQGPDIGPYRLDYDPQSGLFHALRFHNGRAVGISKFTKALWFETVKELNRVDKHAQQGQLIKDVIYERQRQLHLLFRNDKPPLACLGVLNKQLGNVASVINELDEHADEGEHVHQEIHRNLRLSLINLAASALAVIAVLDKQQEK